jgi:protein gp37
MKWSPIRPLNAGNVEMFLDEKMLLAPLRWQRPRRIFVCPMTDLFARFVRDEWIDCIFAVMALAPQHTFQCLTKHADRMQEYLSAEKRSHMVWRRHRPWPLPNVHLGVSVEDDGRELYADDDWERWV